jgi:mannosyltransferase
MTPPHSPATEQTPSGDPESEAGRALPDEERTGGAPATFDPRTLLVFGLPALAALAAGLWRLGTPSPWQDETATVVAARLPVPQLIRLVHHVDLVHAIYYLFMHGVVDLLGVSAVAIRLPSVVATVLAAAGTAAIGRRLHSNRAGLLAGLIYAALPAVSQYAQEARSYAIVSALAVLATYLMVHAAQRPTTARLACYGAAALTLGMVNIMTALLLVPAHAVVIFAAWRSDPAPAAIRRPGLTATFAPRGSDATSWAARPFGRRWLVTLAAVVAVLVPLVVLDHGQAGAVSWIVRPHIHDFGQAMVSFAGSAALVTPIIVLVTLGCQSDRSPRPNVVTVGLAWFAVPVALLFAASQFESYYLFRYLVFCEPAVALLAGAGLARFRPPVIAATLATILVLGLPAQLQLRLPDSKGPDSRQAISAVRDLARPGDAILYVPTYRRTYAAAYPQVLGALNDIGLGASTGRTGVFGGRDVSSAELIRRLRTAPRVWVLRIATPDFGGLAAAQQRSEFAALKDTGFTAGRHWRSSTLTLTLYVRSPTAG